MTTDSFVVKPIRFPGGSIGELAVNGTVNDLAVAGARPLALTLSLILEEGLDADELRAEVEAIAARRRGRPGSRSSPATPRSSSAAPADSMYICTTGSRAWSTRGRALSPAAIEPGDRVLVSGTIGEHGTAIMLARGELGLDAEVESDTRSLWPAADALLEAAGAGLRCMRDATRGGVASVLNELARASGVAIACARRTSRCSPRWRAPPSCSGSTRCTWRTRASSWRSSRPRPPTRRSPRCARCRAASGAAEIGEVRAEPPGMVLVETAFGGRRVMDQLVGDPLPRIC